MILKIKIPGVDSARSGCKNELIVDDRSYQQSIKIGREQNKDCSSIVIVRCIILDVWHYNVKNRTNGRANSYK